MFTREDTKMIKGVAVLLMLMHHMFCFQERFIDGFTYAPSIMQIAGYDFWTDVMGQFGKLCVALFMFLGGYGLYHRYSKGAKLQNILLNLYTSYWKVFVVFIPIGFLFFRNQPDNYCQDAVICSVFSNFNLPEFFGNFIGYYSSYNREWWFFKTYVCVSFLGWIFITLFKKKKSFWVDLFVVLLLDILLQCILPSLASPERFPGLTSNIFFANGLLLDYSATSFFVGIVFAKYNAFQKIEEMATCYTKIVRITIALIGIVVVISVRTLLFSMWLDWMLAPVFIVFTKECMQNISLLGKGFQFIGKYCNEMWLIHSFYCYYFYKITKLVFVSRFAFVDLMVLIGITLASAVFLEKFWLGLAFIGKKTKLVQG